MAMKPTIEPVVGGVARRDWRAMVLRSRLPSSVKLTLLEHATLTRWHWHDDLTNEHAITRERLARRLNINERTVRRHLRRAETEGWLVRHRDGHNGQQAVFHYVAPSRECTCIDRACRSRGTGRGTERGTLTAPYEGGQEGPPYVVTYPHHRDDISGAVRAGPDHALLVASPAASTDEMKGWPAFRPGHRLCPLIKLRAAVPAAHSVASPSRVRHLAGAMA